MFFADCLSDKLLDPRAADPKIQIIPFDKVVVFHTLLSIISRNGTCAGTEKAFSMLPLSRLRS
jgi:hypothetical protein